MTGKLQLASAHEPVCVCMWIVRVLLQSKLKYKTYSTKAIIQREPPFLDNEHRDQDQQQRVRLPPIGPSSTGVDEDVSYRTRYRMFREPDISDVNRESSPYGWQLWKQAPIGFSLPYYGPEPLGSCTHWELAIVVSLVEYAVGLVLVNWMNCCIQSIMLEVEECIIVIVFEKYDVYHSDENYLMKSTKQQLMTMEITTTF